MPSEYSELYVWCVEANEATTCISYMYMTCTKLECRKVTIQCLVNRVVSCTCTCGVRRRKFCFLECPEIQSALCSPGPDLILCDEGHRIKNDYTNISQALKKIRTRSDEVGHMFQSWSFFVSLLMSLALSLHLLLPFLFLPPYLPLSLSPSLPPSIPPSLPLPSLSPSLRPSLSPSHQAPCCSYWVPTAEQSTRVLVYGRLCATKISGNKAGIL